MLKVNSNKQYTIKLRRVISKIMVPSSSALPPHTFLHRIKTSVVKIRPALKIHIYFMNSKHSIGDAWQGSKYASGSEYPRVLNSPGF